MSQEESRSEDKTEFHGIEERRELIEFMSALWYIEPDTTAGGFVMARKRKRKRN